MNRLALLLLLLAAPALAQPPATPPPTPEPPAAADTIQFPAVLAPTPPPAPPPGGVAVLPADCLYVVTASKPFFLLASPPGPVSVEYDSGPLTIVARFVEQPDKTMKRKFTDPYLAVVRAVGVGRVELIAVPAGVTKESDIIRRLVDCQTAPQPPPVPPQPGPTPPGPTPPSPAPIPAPGLRALFVYETAELSKMTPAQVSILYSRTIRDYLNQKAVTGPDGKTKEYRFWDKDVDASKESQLWQDALKRPRTTTPWLIISNGTAGYEGPFPATLADTLALLQKFGG